MKYIFPVFLGCLLSLPGFSQLGKNRYKMDVTTVYNPDEKVYTFDLEGKKQGFYWGDSLTSEMPLGNVRFRVRNNTGQIVAITRMDASDGPVLYQPLKRPEYLMPDEILEMRPVFVRKEGPFTKSLYVAYQKGTEQKELYVVTWGNFPFYERTAENVSKEPVIKPKDELKECRITVKRGNKQLITDQCEMILWRPSGLETIKPVVDSAEYAYFPVKGTENEVFKATINSRDFGSMETWVVISRGDRYEEFVGTGESYYYDGYWRTRYVPDSSRYLLEFNPKGTSYDSICDSIRKVAVAAKIPFVAIGKGCSMIQVVTNPYAILLEKKLLAGPHSIRMTPYVWREGDQKPALMWNECDVVFHDSVPESWVNRQFKELGIVRFYKNKRNENSYSIYFIHSADLGYQRILDDLWQMKEVVQVRQHVDQVAEGWKGDR